MKLYNFSQNNSGGGFVDDANLCPNTIFEANTYKGANKRAKVAGIYFNGCSKGMDCSCCGDRWYKQYDDEVDDYTVFEFTDKEAAIKYFTEEYEKSWFRDNVILYFKDGSKYNITLTKQRAAYV